jgi:hypothetical protein
VQFEELYRLLIDTARQRVCSGEFTERRLARLCNLSQPHMHNVLNNLRSLSPESADRLMNVLDLNVQALIFRSSGTAETAVCAVPVLRSRLGPGFEPVLTNYRGFMPFSEHRVASLVEPVVAQLAPDFVLPKPLAANDYVLLDRNPSIRANPAGGGYWVVADSTGLRVRYVKLGGTRVYLANESNIRDPPNWQPVPLHERNLLEIVRARIVWISREMETTPAAPPDAPGSGHRRHE